MHTPGPWEVISEETCTVRAATCRTVCRLSFTRGLMGPRMPNKEVQANARLIAASPELLTRVESLLAMSDLTWGEGALKAPGIVGAQLDGLRKFIAEIKGDSEC